MQAARRALGPERVSRTHVSVKRYQIKQLKEKGNFSHRFSILPPSLKMTVWGDCFGMGSKRKKYPWGSCNERRGNAPPPTLDGPSASGPARRQGGSQRFSAEVAFTRARSAGQLNSFIHAKHIRNQRLPSQSFSNRGRHLRGPRDVGCAWCRAVCSVDLRAARGQTS